MRAIEELDELAVPDGAGLVGQSDGFSVPGTTRADLAVSWAASVSARS